MKSKLVGLGTSILTVGILASTNISHANEKHPDNSIKENVLTVEKALESHSQRTKGKRIGLGSYQRQRKNSNQLQYSQPREIGSQNSERRSSNRIFGGRNSYHRYLKSKSATNTKKRAGIGIAQKRTRNTSKSSEMRTESTSELRERRSSSRVFGGRNSYHRYLESLKENAWGR